MWIVGIDCRETITTNDTSQASELLGSLIIRHSVLGTGLTGEILGQKSVECVITIIRSLGFEIDFAQDVTVLIIGIGPMSWIGRASSMYHILLGQIIQSIVGESANIAESIGDLLQLIG